MLHYATFHNDETGTQDLIMNSGTMQVKVIGHGSGEYKIYVDEKTQGEVRAVTNWEQPYTIEHFGEALVWATPKTIMNLVLEVASEGQESL